MIDVILSHDVDRVSKSYQYFSKGLTFLIKGKIKLVLNQIRQLISTENPYWMFHEIMKIEETLNVKSTFFFLNESIRFNILNPYSFFLAFGRYSFEDERIRKIIKLLDADGWSVGLHGSYNSYDNFDLLMKEKQQLEEILSHAISGIRQHHLNLSENTWLYQKKAGFLFDSSWGSNNEIGFFNGKFKPFSPFEDDFTVFPLVIMDSCFMDKKDRWSYLDTIIEECIKHNSVLVINWHQRVFNELDFPGYKKAYIDMIYYIKKLKANFIGFDEFLEKRKINVRNKRNNKL